jgi:alpha-ketoglutarate-dependent taurine dioxygenase
VTESAPLMVGEPIDGPSAWTAHTVGDATWRVSLSDGCRSELLGVLDQLRAKARALEQLDSADYRLSQTLQAAADTRRLLDSGAGFVLIDRLPMCGLSADEAKALYWLFSNAVCRVVAGAWDGRVLHDVVDLDKQQGLRVRGDLTKQEIAWHTDNGFSCTPDHVGLLCIRPALDGGRNSLLSVHSAHNLMRERHADLLARLYQPFYWNRMGEHHPQASPVNRYPYFEHDGKFLKGRINRRVVYAGYELVGERIDAVGRAAVDAFFELLDDPSLAYSLTLEAGQILYLNNRLIAHHRTPFVDAADPRQRRHLVRIYMRDDGLPSYLGV